ncbi:conserved hypothetical protein [Paraburkholderia piptadeniae]|uniref:TniQ domain-containing protein n=2 Tax=Paraburkholderia piptadeniae TaxID=1701573 RepID=A0A1N7S2X1_9BURK|nr:conserved hypothetical protein [Paraburkholderia piptadeniae]
MRAVAPLFRDNEGHMRRTIRLSYYDLTMHGLSETAAAWVDALERLTMRNDLALRTLLPLSAVVSSFKLLSKIERFCACCYRDDEVAGRPKYNRLLWSIDCVEACPIHNVLLQTVPYARDRKQYKFWVPGLSRLDGANLAKYAARDADEEQAQSARLVADMLDDIYQYPDAFAHGCSPDKFVRHAVSTLFGGQPMRLANHLGIARSDVCGWCSEKMKPSLPRMVLLAYCCGCCVSDVLLGNRVMLRKVYRTSDADPLNCRSDKPSETLLEELEFVFRSGSAQNLHQAAQLLGVTERYLHKLAPDIAASLVQEGMQKRRSAKDQRAEARFHDFWQSFQDLRSQGSYPVREKVAARMRRLTGTRLNFYEAARFHARACRQAETTPHSGTAQRGDAD